jgi:hypothetical protein
MGSKDLLRRCIGGELIDPVRAGIYRFPSNSKLLSFVRFLNGCISDNASVAFQSSLCLFCLR